MATTHDLGDLVTCQAEFTDTDGNYQDPTDVYIAVTDPSGNEAIYHYGADPEVVRSSTGIYYVNVDADEVGEWWYRGYATGTGQAADKTAFYVEDKGVSYVKTLASDRDKVRFYIRDTVKGFGPRPDSDDSNFTDSELDAIITVEGSWQAAIAACYEALSAEWAQYVDTQVGPRREMYSQAAERYQFLARDWRRKSGFTAISGGAGVRYPTPVDGYSSDVRIDE